MGMGTRGWTSRLEIWAHITTYLCPAGCMRGFAYARPVSAAALDVGNADISDPGRRVQLPVWLRYDMTIG